MSLGFPLRNMKTDVEQSGEEIDEIYGLAPAPSSSKRKMNCSFDWK